MAESAPKSSSTFLIFGALLGALGWGAASLGPVQGAEQSAIPDFAATSSIGWIASGSGFGTDFVQPPSGPAPVTNDPAHPYVTNVAAAATGKQPTFRVADLSNPILQPWAVERMRKANQDVLAGKVAFTADARCFPSGVPSFLLFPANPVRFVQTPKEVLMVWQQDAQIRHVYLNQPHSAHPAPSWYGESIGHYENGDTLVVDTIGQNDKSFVDNYRTPHTTQLHVIERFKLIDGGKTIDVQIHVEDPGAFTTPWNAIQRYRRVEDGPMIEMVCAENNGSYFNYDVVPIPQAAKPDF
ncbi:MAG TPA: hypothetical protein VHT51_09375 [Micropepsaceae bacterium]|nr:hypothetical protein [Micropepsaceae bacterium]